MKGFILKTTESEMIAIVRFHERDEFYQTIRLAISEHFICDVNDVSLNIKVSDYFDNDIILAFEVETIENGEIQVRDFILKQITIY